MRHLFDRPLGACAPCGFLFKNATFDVGSLISSGLSFAGQMATNQINAERAASDMATYLNMVKTQRKWQKEDQLTSMLNTKALMDYQNAYDSPSAQRKRYEEAGLNPYLAANSGQIGSGNSMSIPNPNLGERAGVSPIQRPALENPVSSAADKLFNASALKSQRMAALSSFSKALPDLVKSVGKEGAVRIASSYLGQDLDMSRIEQMAANQAAISQYEENIASVRSEVAQQTSLAYANNLVSLQQMEFAKYSGEFNLMQSQTEENRAKIRVAASEYVRNIADSLHLKKVGDYYEANAVTVNALRDLTKQSLQYHVNSQKRQDITEQTIFDAQRNLRSHIREEGLENPQDNRFIQNWDVDNDPFYNEVNKVLGSFRISTNFGFSGSYGSKDFYGHGFGY